MNGRNRSIRALLASMGPRRAERFIRAFDLQDDEAQYIIEREAQKKSINEIARLHNVSPETVKRRRKSGFSKMADQIP